MSLEYEVGERRSESEIYTDLLRLEPKPITLFLPKNREDEKERFLSGEIVLPNHEYERLGLVDNFDERIKNLEQLSAEIISSSLDERLKDIYHIYVKRFTDVTKFLLNVQRLHYSVDVDRDALLEEIKQQNRELWGEADEITYRALIAELNDMCESVSPVNDKVSGLKQELLEKLPLYSNAEHRFKPSEDTVQSVSNTVAVLYENLFNHIPVAEEMFDSEKVVKIFQDIIDSEFEEAATGWVVVLDKSAAINVVAGEKIIKIPEARKPMSRQALKGMIAHEIGVHMLRAISGASTDVKPLMTGFPGYYDSEEGLGKVMEQGAKGSYEDSGVPYYLITGMSQHDDMNVRDVFEIMWRRACLLEAKDGKALSESKIERIRADVYDKVMRVFRGTDKIAWSKDLAYFNGAEKMWKYMEASKGDDMALALALMGKADPTVENHRRVLLESRTT